MLRYLQNIGKIQITRSYATVAVKTKENGKKQRFAKVSPIISCKRKELNFFSTIGKIGNLETGSSIAFKDNSKSTFFEQDVPDKCKSEPFMKRDCDPNTKFGTIPLCSKGWLHDKSKGDHFTIHATASDEEINTKMQNISKFLESSNLQLYEELIQNLKIELDIQELTDIQVRGIPKIIDYSHTLIAAETGCGKTLTYLLPIVQRVLERKRAIYTKINENPRKMNTPLALIITPGRELASQIGEVTKKLCHNSDLNVKTILGGNTKRLMLNPDFEDVDVLVATIGALSKLVTTGVFRMEEVRHVVLDEADTLLDDSFTDKLVHFLKRFPFHKNHIQDEHNAGTQLILASATMPTNVEDMLQKIVNVQTIHEVTSPNLHKIMPHVEQKFLRMSKAIRPATLLNTVKTELIKKRPLIIFSNKSATSDYVSLFLNNNGVNCLNLNGNMLMKIRIGRFEKFQNGECDVLSTTDVGSRGLDTMRARHVINFEFPLFVSDYIHRCGRIGRVGNYRKCFVTNFISSRSEIGVVQRIEHAARTGGLLPNVNANIKNLITKRVMKEMNIKPDEMF